MKSYKRFSPTSFVVQRDFSAEGLAIVIPKTVARALNLKAGTEVVWKGYDDEGNIQIKIQRK